MCQCFSAGKLSKTGKPLFVILSAGYLAAGILEPVRGGEELRFLKGMSERENCLSERGKKGGGIRNTGLTKQGFKKMLFDRDIPEGIGFVPAGGEKPVGVTGAQEVNKTGWKEKAVPVYLFLKLPDKKDVNE